MLKSSSASPSVGVFTMCAPEDQRKSRNNQRGQLNRKRFNACGGPMFREGKIKWSLLFIADVEP